MKKLLLTLISLIMCFSITACSMPSFGKDKLNENEPVGEPMPLPDDTPIDEVPEIVVATEPTTQEVTEIVTEQPAQSGFDFEIIGSDIKVEEPEETILSVYINDVLVTMPLAYVDLEKQGLSVDYNNSTNCTNDVQRAFDLDPEGWVSIRSKSGDELAFIADDRNGTASKVVTNNNKVMMLFPKLFSTQRYFDLVTGESSYDECLEKIKTLGFDYVSYANIGMTECIIGNIDLNGNECQVWFTFSTFNEAGVLDSIALVNKSVIGSDIISEFHYKDAPYGVEEGGLNEELFDTPTSDVMKWKFGSEEEYTVDSTISDYVNYNWTVTDMKMSESGGTCTLTLQRGPCIIYMTMASLYITTVNNQHDIDADALPASIEFNKECLDYFEMFGLTGIISKTKIEDSKLSQVGESNTGETIEGCDETLSFDFNNFGSIHFGLLDGYVNIIRIDYLR